MAEEKCHMEFKADEEKSSDSFFLKENISNKMIILDEVDPSFYSLSSNCYAQKMIMSFNPDDPSPEHLNAIAELLTSSSLPEPEDLFNSPLQSFIQMVNIESPLPFIRLWIQILNCFFLAKNIPEVFFSPDFLSVFVSIVHLVNLDALSEFDILFGNIVHHTEHSDELSEVFRQLEFPQQLLYELNLRSDVEILFSIANRLITLFYELDDVSPFEEYPPILIYALKQRSTQYIAMRCLTGLVFDPFMNNDLKKTSLCSTIAELIEDADQATISESFVIINEFSEDPIFHTEQFYKAASKQLANWGNDDIRPILYFIKKNFVDDQTQMIGYGFLDFVIQMSAHGKMKQKKKALTTLCRLFTIGVYQGQPMWMRNIFGAIIDCLPSASQLRAIECIELINKAIHVCPTVCAPIAIAHELEEQLVEFLDSDNEELVGLAQMLLDERHDEGSE